MREAIPVIEQLHRHTPELLPADRDPRIALVDQVRHQPAQAGLVAADRHRPQGTRLAEQCSEIAIDILGVPFPRPAASERDQRTRRLQVRLDRLGLEIPRDLPRGPPLQHRLPDRVLQMQRPHPGTEHSAERQVGVLGGVDAERTPQTAINFFHQTRESRIAESGQGHTPTIPRSQRPKRSDETPQTHDRH
jgi:hypothetical protein